MEDHQQGAPEVVGEAARRRFLKTTGKAAVAAPAVALLLAAGVKGANAQALPYGQETPIDLRTKG